MTARIYAVANRKGGCGKTTTVGSLASIANSRGVKTLAVDMDPQGSLTYWCGLDTTDELTAYEVLTNKTKAKDAIVSLKRYDLLPADLALLTTQVELDRVAGKEHRLEEALAEVEEDYDMILIDTPAQYGLLMDIANTAAKDGIVITTDAGAFSTQGMKALQDSLEGIQKYYNPGAKVIGILLTKFNEHWNVMKAMKGVTTHFAEYFAAPLYDTFIRQSVSIMEAQLDVLDILDIDEKNIARKDYESWTSEFLSIEDIEYNRR